MPNHELELGLHTMQPAQAELMEPQYACDSAIGRLEKLKASIRAKVEHRFNVIKNLFRRRKARYRGLAKNGGRLLSLFGFANLLLANRRMHAIHGRGAS